MKVNPKHILVISPILLLLFLVVLFPLFSKFLSKTSKVAANILLVEGWLPQPALELAYAEFVRGDYDYIVTTGLSIPDFYPVVMNGDFVFYTDKFLNNLTDKVSQHTIEVILYSEMEGEHCSHFNFYINDSVISDFCVGKKKRGYKINYSGLLTDIDSITIQFDNDAMGDFGDHNLFVKELLIDNEIIISYKSNSLYNRTARGWQKRIRIDYSTYAGVARNRLIELGADSIRVFSVPNSNLAKHRTLSSALSFKDWLFDMPIDIYGINIVSEGIHARRTWISYKYVLLESYSVGIISLPSSVVKRSYIGKVLDFIKETVDYFYYKYILLKLTNS